MWLISYCTCFLPSICLVCTTFKLWDSQFQTLDLFMLCLHLSGCRPCILSVQNSRLINYPTLYQPKKPQHEILMQNLSFSFLIHRRHSHKNSSGLVAQLRFINISSQEICPSIPSLISLFGHLLTSHFLANLAINSYLWSLFMPLISRYFMTTSLTQTAACQYLHHHNISSHKPNPFCLLRSIGATQPKPTPICLRCNLSKLKPLRPFLYLKKSQSRDVGIWFLKASLSRQLYSGFPVFLAKNSRLSPDQKKPFSRLYCEHFCTKRQTPKVF